MHEHAALILVLPVSLIGEGNECINLVECRPVLQAPQLAQDGASFRWAPDAAIIVIRMSVHSPSLRRSVNFCLIVPVRALLKRIAARSGSQATTPELPWSEWAADAQLFDYRLFRGGFSVCNLRWASTRWVNAVVEPMRVPTILHFEPRRSFGIDPDCNGSGDGGVARTVHKMSLWTHPRPLDTSF